MNTATPIRPEGGAARLVRDRHILPASGASSPTVACVRAPNRHLRVSLLRACLALALAGVPLAASAAYKCPAGNGHFTYQDLPCEQPADEAPAADPAPAAAPSPTPAVPVAAAPAPAHAAPATATPAAAQAAAAPAPMQGAAAPARPAPALLNAAPAATSAAPQPKPYMGEDLDNADPDADTADDGSDAGDDPADAGPAGADERDAEAAANISLSAIFARLALKAVIWLAVAGLVGYRATQRNRGFFKWAFLALVFSPLLVYIVLRVMGPAEESA